MKTTHILVWLALALLVQTTLVPLVAGGGAPVDLVLVVVVFAALNRGPVAGLWTGTVAGLLQDALSGGIIGVSGLTKTIIGVVVGVVGSRFLLGTVWHRLAVLVGASFVHAFCYPRDLHVDRAGRPGGAGRHRDRSSRCQCIGRCDRTAGRRRRSRHVPSGSDTAATRCVGDAG